MAAQTATSPVSNSPTKSFPDKGVTSAGGSNKLAAALLGNKSASGPPPASGGLGKLAALMKKPTGNSGQNAKTDAKSNSPTGNAKQGAGGDAGGGGLMGMLFLKKKLNKWRTSKLKTWNMNESTTSTVKSSLENTYRLEPGQSNKFLPAKVKECIENVLQQRLKEDTRYNPPTFAILTRLIADEIKEEVKGLGFDRYKLVVHVMLCQNLTQGLQTASRCIWDPSTDNSATVTFRSNQICAVINVFGIYFE